MNKLNVTSMLLALALAHPTLGQTFTSTPDSNLKGNEATTPGESFSTAPPTPLPRESSEREAPPPPQETSCSDRSRRNSPECDVPPPSPALDNESPMTEMPAAPNAQP